MKNEKLNAGTQEPHNMEVNPVLSPILSSNLSFSFFIFHFAF
jgi:hypothetical protein